MRSELENRQDRNATRSAYHRRNKFSRKRTHLWCVPCKGRQRPESGAEARAKRLIVEGDNRASRDAAAAGAAAERETRIGKRGPVREEEGASRSESQ
jgi:hypothetical protein